MSYRHKIKSRGRIRKIKIRRAFKRAVRRVRRVNRLQRGGIRL